MPDEVSGASQTALLAREEGEENGASVGDIRQRIAQQLGGVHHPRVAGGIVVRARVDGVHVRLHRALTAVPEVIVVCAEHDDLVRQRAAAREDGGDVLAVIELRFHIGDTTDVRRQHARARLQIGVDILLKLGQIDPGILQPALRNRRLHLDYRNPGRTLRPVVHERRNLVLPFVLNRPGGEDHRHRAALARLQDLVAHGRPAARPASVELRVVVFLLRLVPQHQHDFPVYVDAVEVVVPDRRGVDAVAGEDERSGERSGAGEAEWRPVAIRHPLQLVAAAERDAHLDGKRLSKGLAERRLQSERAQPALDVVCCQADALRTEAAAFHVRRGQSADIGLDRFRQLRVIRKRGGADQEQQGESSFHTANNTARYGLRRCRLSVCSALRRANRFRGVRATTNR